MKRLISAGLFTLVSILPAFIALAEDTPDPLAGAPSQYSADLVVSRKVGPPMTIKVYVDGDKRRTDQGVPGGNIIILRGDLTKRYILTPSSKTYMELPLDPRMLETPTDWAKRMGLIHEKVGTEEVNGELCDKYRYATDPKKTGNAQNQPTMPMRAQITGFIWVGQSTHMLVKSENGGSTAEWTNIKIGPPDASVFEVPSDYKKAESRFKLQGQKPGEQQKPELKLGGESPSPSPSASPSDEKKSEGDKSTEQKPGELKSGGESPSPSPSASPSDEQKSDGDK